MSTVQASAHQAPAPYTFEPPPYRDQFRQRGRLFWMILVGIVAVAGFGAAVYFFAFTADETRGIVLSLVYALVPLPMLWFSYWWLDRYEPEPRRYLIAAFVWGAVISVLIAILLQIWISNTWDLTDQQLATFIAPITEEPAKALFLLLTFIRARRIIDGVLDGLILSGLVGIGFAFVENIGYYAASYLGGPDMPVSGVEGTTTTFVVRGIFSPFAHPLFTSAIGIAIGLAVTRRSWWAKISLGVVGLLGSMLLHGVWNGAASYGGGAGFLLMYLALACVLAGLATLAIVIRSRQVKALERSLSYVAQRGWIHPAEIPYLSRFGYRSQARKYARDRYGKQAEAVVKRYQKFATEMAFLHDRVMQKQNIPNGVERTYALLDAMYALRPGVRLPPPMAPISRP